MSMSILTQKDDGDTSGDTNINENVDNSGDNDDLNSVNLAVNDNNNNSNNNNNNNSNNNNPKVVAKLSSTFCLSPKPTSSLSTTIDTPSTLVRVTNVQNVIPMTEVKIYNIYGVISYIIFFLIQFSFSLPLPPIRLPAEPQKMRAPLLLLLLEMRVPLLLLLMYLFRAKE